VEAPGGVAEHSYSKFFCILPCPERGGREVVIVSLYFAPGACRDAMRACAELWELIGQRDRDPKNFRKIIVGGKKSGKYFLAIESFSENTFLRLKNLRKIFLRKIRTRDHPQSGIISNYRKTCQNPVSPT